MAPFYSFQRSKFKNQLISEAEGKKMKKNTKMGHQNGT
jgi:hypothetical protein